MLELSVDFIKELEKLIPGELEDFKLSLETERQKTIRLNPFKINEKVLKDLEVFELEKTPFDNNTYYVTVNQPLGQYPLYHQGVYYPQELSASIVVDKMNIQCNDLVLDCCSAPGGKSTQILSHLTTGFLVCNEIVPKRLKVLKENLYRFGSDRYGLVSNDVSEIKDEFKGVFDKVLVDAPCSGEGMIKRFPELTKQYSIKNINKLHQLQVEILSNAIECCKDGGRVMYSTCTFNTMENEQVLEEVLKKYPDCKLIDLEMDDYSRRGVGKYGHQVLRYYPHTIGEGHFMACIEVHHGISSNAKSCQNEKVTNHEDEMFEVDKSMLDIIHLNWQSIGRVLTLQDKPHWANALLINKSIDIELDLTQSYLYLNGQVLPSEQKGFMVVGHNGLGLGVVKGDGTWLKNHYPKHLRNRFSQMK